MGDRTKIDWCNARISGSVTDHKEKRMYLEISFYENEEESKHDDER